MKEITVQLTYKPKNIPKKTQTVNYGDKLKSYKSAQPTVNSRRKKTQHIHSTQLLQFTTTVEYKSFTKTETSAKFSYNAYKNNLRTPTRNTIIYTNKAIIKNGRLTR